MANIEKTIQATLEDLAQARDELRLQIHLGTAETKAEWERLETKWHELQRKHQPLKNAVEKTAKELGSVAELLVSELREGYQRIRAAVVR